jgi:hypothetical protein
MLKPSSGSPALFLKEVTANPSFASRIPTGLLDVVRSQYPQLHKRHSFPLWPNGDHRPITSAGEHAFDR